MLSRRVVLMAPLAQVLTAQSNSIPAGKMVLSIHLQTSRAAGYKGALEGWAKAGIKYVEITDSALDQFLRNETIAVAKRVLTDNGLTPVSGASVLGDIWVPGPARAASLETWKKRAEQFAGIGLKKIYCPSITNRRVTPEEDKGVPDAVRESGEIAKQFDLTAMIEFAHTSTHLATLPTTLKVIREANHPNVRPMLDFFHFWAGRSKFEDLDMLQPGELQHVHFQDILDVPRETIDNNGRVIPGDGAAPVVKILQKLKEKQYSGPLSVELFLARLSNNANAEETGAEIKQKCEKVMQQAGVL